MDGLKCVVPYSCRKVKENYHQINLFESTEEETSTNCPGCEKSDIYNHNGIYCRIFDWTNYKKSIPFIDVLKEGANRGKI